MSIALMTTAWTLTGLSSTQKLVLLSLADNANDQGECYPSIRQMVSRTCLSERAVRDAIRILETLGYVRSMPRVGTSTIYLLELSQAQSQTPAPAAPPAGDAPRQEVPPTPAPAAPPPRQQAPPTPAAGAPKPSLNRQLNRQVTVKARTKPGIEVAAIALPDWLPRQTWIDWVQHRIAVKAPMTERAGELALGHLARLREAGNDPVAVIEQSVRSGKWTDLYALKNQNQPQAPGGANSRQAENERRSAGFLRLIGAGQADGNTIEMEPTHATR